MYHVSFIEPVRKFPPFRGWLSFCQHVTEESVFGKVGVKMWVNNLVENFKVRVLLNLFRGRGKIHLLKNGYHHSQVSLIFLIVTNAPAINLRGVLFPDDSTELFYLHAIASGFEVKYYEHNTSRTDRLITRLEITGNTNNKKYV